MPDTRLRILYLMEILRGTDEAHPKTTAGLVRALRSYGVESCARTIGSDLAALRDAGWCIPVHPQRRRGCYLVEQPLEDHEALLLADMVSAAPFLTPGDTRALLRKLCALSSPTAARVVRRTRRESALKNDDVRFKLTLHTILRALYDKRQLEFCMAGSARRLCVSPQTTAYREGAYVLLGQTETGAAAFRIDQMREVMLLPLPCLPDARQDVQRPLRLTLLCIGDSAPLWDRFGRPARTEETPDGLRAQVEVTEDEALYGWLLAHAEALEVLSPERVRAALRRRLMAGLARYGAAKKA